MKTVELTKHTVIDCNIWARAPYHADDWSARTDSGLLKNNKRCCLGFAAQQSGVRDKEMRYKLSPSSLNIKIENLALIEDDGHTINTPWTTGAMAINDSKDFTDHEKIELLTEHWKKLGSGFSVEFINIPSKKEK